MKPFDPKGEYTAAEVKAALAGVNGTRQLSYRYERLDKDNKFIEEIDFIQECTIENNSLADIKRTAKMDVLDTGSINYLQDRIKPYVRIAMPPEVTYRDAVSDLNPSVWWSLNDNLPQDIVYTSNQIGGGTTYATAATAYDLDATGKNGAYANIKTGDATVRSEFWWKKAVSPAKAQDINIYLGDFVGGTMTYEVYSSAFGTGENLTLMKSGTLGRFNQAKITKVFPKNGYYFVRLVATAAVLMNPYAIITTAFRLEDSSGNKVYGSGTASASQQKVTSIISDGGTAVSQTNEFAQFLWTTDELPEIRFTTGLTTSFWQKDSHNTVAAQSNKTSFTYTFEEGQTLKVMYERVMGQDVKFTIQVLTALGSNYMTEYVYVPESVIGDKVHLYTFALDYTTKKAKVYVDGIERGAVTIFSYSADLPAILATKVTKIDGSVWVGKTGTMVVDDITMFPYPLSMSQISTLHDRGTSAIGTERRGYVEWPQGVFVLSSPTRKMINGNTIVREVEGYDQLVTLKEDSFDYRYSIKQGVTYSQAVRNVLQSSSPNLKIPLSAKTWTTLRGGTILSEDSFRLNSYGNSMLYIGDDYSIVGASVSGKFSQTTYADSSRTCVSLQTWNASSAYTIQVQGTQIWGGNNGANVWQATYSSTAHAYWRLREADGFIYYELSPDGIVWTVFGTERHSLNDDSRTLSMVYSDFGSSPNTASVTNFTYKAAKIISAAVETTSKTLPQAMEWEAGTSKLTIINDLLSAVNYTSATYDEDGMFVAKPYISPQLRSAQYRYATDDTSVITGDVDQTIDIFAVPNKWILVVSDPEGSSIVGTYTNSDPNSPTSTVARGRTIVDKRDEQSAPDQITLDAQAARLAFEASQVYEVIEFNTALMPIHQDADVYDIAIDGLAVSNKYAEHTWSMTLANGSTMRHRARRVVSV